jgi:ABC-type dipeptide/oligopeptide/nickel transport system permease subunit
MVVTGASGGLAEPLEAVEMRRGAGALRRLLRKRIAVVCLLVIAVIYLAGLLAPFVAPHGFNDIDLENTFSGPSLEHPLGTDRLGRDVLSRVIWSAQTTLIVSGAAVLSGGLLLGVGLGLLAGYVGGRLDNFIMRVADAFFALPDILLLIIIVATVRDKVVDMFRNFEEWFGIGGIVSSGAPDYFLIFTALSLFGWVGMARVIRSQVLSLRESDYVLAARAVGASVWRVIFRHLLPNVSNIIVVSVTFSLGVAGAAEVGLSFLGVGVRPPHPSFGAMIFDAAGARNIQAHPSLIFIPSAVIAALLLAFNLLGDALNDVLNPRRR